MLYYFSFYLIVYLFIYLFIYLLFIYLFILIRRKYKFLQMFAICHRSYMICCLGNKICLQNFGFLCHLSFTNLSLFERFWKSKTFRTWQYAGNFWSSITERLFTKNKNMKCVVLESILLTNETDVLEIKKEKENWSHRKKKWSCAEK